MTKIRFGLKGLKPSDLIAKCQSVEEKMTDNALFPNPVPALADLTAARETLETLTTAARFGDREAIARRRTQEAATADILRRLGSYVQAIANKPEDILGAGFDLRRQAEPVTRLSRPAGLEALRSDTQGRVNLDWKAVKGSQHYLVEYAQGDPSSPATEWSLAAYTSRSKYTIDHLAPGTYYWFRVRALGPAGQSEYSDPAMVMAA